MKRVATAVVLLALLGVAGCGEDAEPPTVPVARRSSSSLVGYYSKGAPSAGAKLTLRKDGSYRLHTLDGLETSRGAWLLREDTLTLRSRTFPGEDRTYRVEDDELHQVIDDSIAQARSIMPLPFKREAFWIPSWAKVAPEQIAEAKKHGVPVAFENDLGMRFVLIPSGTFTMGRPADEWPRFRETLREVTITKPYYLQTTEVTKAQYRRFKPEYDRGSQGWRGTTRTLNDHLLPASDLSWDETQGYLKWLNDRESGSAYRLPSEAEWERACRAGTNTRYWSGDKDEDLARVDWYAENSGGRIHAVGEKPASPYGLHDMHGNAWEWCEDIHHMYMGWDPPNGTAWVDEYGDKRVLRGGGYYNKSFWSRAWVRSSQPPGKSAGVPSGFRVARSVTP